MTVVTHAGEFHFAFLDVENSSYTTINRINSIYDYDSNGSLVDVTKVYADSKYTIYYDNSVTDANKSKYIKATNVNQIANGYNATDGVDSSKTSGTGVLNYGGTAGDFAFLDVWTYTVNATKTQVNMSIIIHELDGYDPIELKGLVFFDRNKDGVYKIEDGDFPLSDVEVALYYYYCGTRWSQIEKDANDSVIKLRPAAKTHSIWTEEDPDGNPIDAVEVVDYYYHSYEVELADDGNYYLYSYAADDTLHTGERTQVTDIAGNPVTVGVESYDIETDEGTQTDYKVWIPVIRTTTTSNTGEYIFSGVLVNQNIDVADGENESYFNYIINPVTNPNVRLFELTTSEKASGDFNTLGVDQAQTIKLSTIEDMIKSAASHGQDTSKLSYSFADVGYWFRLYEPPLTVKKIWSDGTALDMDTQITVEIEGFGVDDNKAYYHKKLVLNERNGWKITPADIPAAVTLVDANGDPILDPETNLPQEQLLSYRVTWEQFTKNGRIYRLIRKYSTDELSYYRADTDASGNITSWISLAEDKYPYESFILDMQNSITGDYLYVENWTPGSATLKLTKKSLADNSLLPGATFELLKLNTTTSQYDSIRTSYGSSYLITTDEKGVAEFHGLTPGTYMLSEIRAPTDYRKADDIIFTVAEGENGKAYIVEGEDNNIADSKLDVYDDLDEPPASGIAKYDQYDKLISGAEFKVYAADENYYITNQTAVASATIDTYGRAVFMTEDGSRPMYISELEELLGSKYFVLRETIVPAGYRALGDAHMEIIGSGMSTYVECRNPFDSGVWTGQKVSVSAPDTLQIADPKDYDKVSADKYVDENGVIQYASYTNNGKITGAGTLFAVVLKRCGAEPGVTNLESLTLEGWKPVYGDDIGGYTVMSGSSMGDIIAAANYGEQYGQVVFTPNAAGVAMTATLTNLPGESTRYFTYMYENGLSGSSTEPQYVVAYYYSTASTLAGATEANTVRVTSHGLAGDADDFRRYWATEIQIPDIVNALFVQKTDVYENAVDNAVFALYDAVSDSSGNGYYVGKDSGGSTVYIRLAEDKTQAAVVYDANLENPVTGSYEVNTEDFAAKLATLTTAKLHDGNAYLTSMFPELTNPGVITVTADGQKYTITPAENANGVSCMTVTHDKCTLVDENGSGHLRYLKQGKYYLKEIYVPANYDLNYANVEVAVTDKGVYANAGADGDGVRVGNGAGYLVSTMNVFASIGDIDETLSYIIGKQKLYYGTEFYTSPLSEWTVSSDANTWLYLQYAGSANSAGVTSDEDFRLFDYTNRLAPDAPLRLWTESGWSDMAVYQDYDYGFAQATTNVDTKYKNLSGKDLSVLYSGSTFVCVTDESVLDLEITKVDSMDERAKLSGASFVLYKYNEDGQKCYYTRSETGTTSWTTAYNTLTTNESGIIEFQALTNGTYYLKEIEAPDGYHRLRYEIVLTVNDGVITIERSDGAAIDGSMLTLSKPEAKDTAGRYVYKLTVPNDGGYEMPNTGGAGNLMFTLGGLAIMAASLVYGCVLRRRKERRIKVNAS